MSSEQTNKDFSGQERLNSGVGAFNQMHFVIWQQLAKLATSMPVKVVAQRGGGVDVVGVVDIMPLVQQLSGDGKPLDHGTITNVPYFRIQGGSSAIIIDPAVGDIGMACFASRDISAVKRQRKKAAPGSKRMYDFSDAMYVGGFLNGTPTQYVMLSANGIKLVSPVAVEIVSPSMTHNGTNVGATHTHPGIEPGGGSTGSPQ